MYPKTLPGTIAFGLLFIIIGAGIVSASPPAQSPPQTATLTPDDRDPFDFLIATLTDAYENDVLPDELSDLLADLLIEYLIVPVTGETPEQISLRLSETRPFHLLIATLTDARNKKALPDELSDLLADLLIENLIAPETGESPDQIQRRLTDELNPRSVQIELPAGWSGYTTHSSGARIEVPQGSTNQTTTVRITEVIPPDDTQLAGKVFDFSVGDAVLQKPATLRIPYETKEGRDASNIVAAHWNEETRAWEEIDGVVDEATQTVEITVSELSWFSIITKPSGIAEITACGISSGNPVASEVFTVSASVKNYSVTGNIYMEFTFSNPGRDIALTFKSDKFSIPENEDNVFSFQGGSIYSGAHYIKCTLLEDKLGPIPDATLDSSSEIYFQIAERILGDRKETSVAYLTECKATTKLSEGRVVAELNAYAGHTPSKLVRMANFSLLYRVHREGVVVDEILKKEINPAQPDSPLPNENNLQNWKHTYTPDSGPGEYQVDCIMTGSLFGGGSQPPTGEERLKAVKGLVFGIFGLDYSPFQHLELAQAIIHSTTRSIQDVLNTTFTVCEQGLECGQEVTPEPTPTPVPPDSEIRPPSGDIDAQIELLLSRPIQIEDDQQAEIPVRVTNTGASGGNFEVQLYSKRSSSYKTVGEEEVFLAPDESRTLTFYFSSSLTGDFGLRPVVRRADTGDILHEPYYSDMITVVDEVDKSDLELSMSVSPSTVDAGENITYTLDVTNHGPDRAKKVMVEISLSQEAVFHSDSRHARCSDPNRAVSTFTCSFSSVSVDETEPGGLTVTVPREASGSVVSAVSVYMDTRKITDPNPTNNTAQVTTAVNSAPAPQSPDKATLIALYNATNGPNWSTSTNWLSNEPIEEWHGVTVDSDGRVTRLLLSENQLSGSIPSSLGSLSNLTWLSLWGNQLSGSIPSSLGSLSNLEGLALAENQLSGSIPSSLGSLSNLTRLILYGNRLSGSIPSELGNLSNLEYLWLHSNQLTGCIPDGLKDVQNNDLDQLGLPFCGDTPTPTATSTDQEADSYYDSGITHHENGDYDLAIADFTRAIELDPNRAEFYHDRGWTYLQKGDYDLAIADFTSAIELDPNRAGAYHDRGWTYLLKDDYDRAIADFTKAIELDPQGAWHYFQRGVSYQSRDADGDLDRAIADFTKAIELDPSEEPFPQELAYAYEARGDDYRDNDGDYDRAIADYTKGIELDSSITAELYHDRGRTYLLKDDYDRAIADFTRAIELEPQNAWHYFQRGQSYQSRDADGDLDRAIADYTKAIELDPSEEPFPQELAYAYEARGDDYRDNDGDYDRAIADYTKGIELDSSITAELYHDRGWTYLLKDDYDRAIADFTKAIELDPQNAWHYFQRGQSYRSRDNDGDLDRAIADFTKAIELDPSEEDFRQALAEAYEAKGDDG